MARRVEIQSAGASMAVVEVWLVEPARRTSMTEPLPTQAARDHAHSLGLEVIDHTQHKVWNAHERATRRMREGWRPQ